MKTTKKELGITKGTGQQFVSGNGHMVVCTEFGNIADVFSPENAPDGEMEANANLFRDAITTANLTGKLPSQLAEENKILLEALKELYKECRPTNNKTVNALKLAKQAIAKAEGRAV